MDLVKTKDINKCEIGKHRPHLSDAVRIHKCYKQCKLLQKLSNKHSHHFKIYVRPSCIIIFFLNLIFSSTRSACLCSVDVLKLVE